MGFAITALLPVFLTILTGFVLRKLNIVGTTHWQSVDHVAYYVLFPAIVAHAIITADFSSVPVARMALALILGLCTMYALLLMTRQHLQSALAIDAPAFTSVFQGAGRWHTFIALAIMPALYGPQGLALAALGAAAIIPVTNLVNIPVLNVYGAGNPFQPFKILKSLAGNPFIVACLFAFAIRFTGITLPGAITGTMDLIGRGAGLCPAQHRCRTATAQQFAAQGPGAGGNRAQTACPARFYGPVVPAIGC